MNVAFGDHQVTTWQADVEARTIGAAVHEPVVYDGRWPGVDVALGHPADRVLPVHRLGDRLLGQRAAAPDPADPADVIGTNPPPIDEHPEPQRRGPARAPARAAGRAADGLRLPAAGRAEPDHRHLRRRPCFAGGFTGP